MTMTRKQAIAYYVEHLTGDDLAQLLQHMNSYDGSFEDQQWYDMDEFDEFLSNHTPMEIALMIRFGEFNPNDEYFRFDAYGNLESANWGDIVDVAEYLKYDIIDHLVNYYSGDTLWSDLDALVYADTDAIFDENYEEVDEDQ